MKVFWLGTWHHQIWATKFIQEKWRSSSREASVREACKKGSAWETLPETGSHGMRKRWNTSLPIDACGYKTDRRESPFWVCNTIWMWSLGLCSAKDTTQVTPLYKIGTLSTTFSLTVSMWVNMWATLITDRVHGADTLREENWEETMGNTAG